MQTLRDSLRMPAVHNHAATDTNELLCLAQEAAEQEAGDQAPVHVVALACDVGLEQC